MELYVGSSYADCHRCRSLLLCQQVLVLISRLINFRFYYPIASNLSFDDSHVVWDTEAYDANATQPLLTYLYSVFALI